MPAGDYTRRSRAREGWRVPLEDCLAMWTIRVRRARCARCVRAREDEPERSLVFLSGAQAVCPNHSAGLRRTIQQVCDEPFGGFDEPFGEFVTNDSAASRRSICRAANDLTAETRRFIRREGDERVGQTDIPPLPKDRTRAPLRSRGEPQPWRPPGAPPRPALAGPRTPSRVFDGSSHNSGPPAPLRSDAHLCRNPSETPVPKSLLRSLRSTPVLPGRRVVGAHAFAERMPCEPSISDSR